MPRDPAPPPFVRLGPPEPFTPLVLAVPHAGRFYPDALDMQRGVAMAVLESLEDRRADRLVEDAVGLGAVAIVATHARAWIDLNRGEEDVGGHGDMAASARARAGLGLVPTRLGGRPLWRSPPDREEVDRRRATVHAPYHAAIARALAAARARHGAALLVDCHSMPPLDRGGDTAPRIVLGDLHGASAAAHVTATMAAVAGSSVHPVARNAPYAGAYTLAAHGRPQANVHAIQIEVDRSLYLTSGLRELSDGAGAIAALMARIGSAGIAALTPDALLAAE